jgi:hypothetical protein
MNLFKEACAIAGSPSGLWGYESSNQKLRNRVFQELLGKGYIHQGRNKNEVTLTYQGKSKPEFV